MKLNYDCMRAALLYLEKQEYYTESEDHIVEYDPVGITQISETLPEYSLVELYYALKNLDEAGYIELLEIESDYGVARAYINRITFKGHEFLEKIKDAGRWSSVKKVLSSVKDYSLLAINAAASGVTEALISKYIDAEG